MAIGSALSGGCALTPPAPAGPLRGKGGRGNLQFGFARGPGTADLIDSDGTRRTESGNADAVWWNSPIPTHAGARLAPARWLDAGFDLGWMDGGVDVRAGQPLEDGATAWTAYAGLRTGQLGLLAFDYADDAFTIRLGAEAQPELTESVRLLLGGGLAMGRYFHYLALPTPEHESTNYGPSHILLSRREVRIEGAIGFDFSKRKGLGGVIIALMPYVVVDAAGLRADTFYGYTVDAYTQHFGLAVVALPWVGAFDR